ncbi:MAG: YcgN family cysteine cluster protein [Candidatus Tokpelaia sp.]|uniref:YcgN family cysteine cluster protein n=1 Tax=Candidatus Tokpelaia sp. TaxID=2233777 RepID=UPI0012388807|nr:YcgN family cysteine cluster protein [Candidatus Tokpelaia sp.]KAA6204387.1 MAG: YcgN family cysteine cluster protein [Candidatus Tokpelaia sp.]KAA6205747.1 MAG: YcgN family cysteine cluster protein [Candidatus Tokpelaia sp.]KAA6404568.1 YcgN family cysteine cluster protein [Candidatus Tokpelaia sp.]
MPSKAGLPFWQVKSLAEMSGQEWESLCDGCGRCCLHKIEDIDTGAIYETSIACILLDSQSCRCRNYTERQKLVPDCIRLSSARQIAALSWLPHDCAYRLVAAGKKLKWWHYLVSGSRDTVHEAGISARGKIKAYENALAEPEDYLPYITHKIA